MSDTGVRRYGRSDVPGSSRGVKIRWQDVAPGSLTRKKLNNRHQFLEFRAQPTVQLKTAAGVAPTGATGTINLLNFGTEGTLEQQILGAGQTLIVPTIKDDGLEISGDATNDEGMELCAGITSRAPSAFQIGTDPAFFFRVRAVIDDVSGADDFAIGWRKNQAYTANVDDYTDFAALNLISGQWFTETALNDAATVSTSLTGSTVADLGAFEVMVKVSATGAVTYEVGTAGVRSAPALAPGFTFDSGDVVVPFVYLLNAADLANSIRLRQWEAGFYVNFEETV